MSIFQSSTRLLHHLAKPQVRIPLQHYQHLGQKIYIRTLASASQQAISPHQPTQQNSVKEPQINNGRIQVFSDTGNNYVDVPAVWLRDHCRCSQCMHEITKQRVLETFDEIPADVAVAPNGLVENGDVVEVTWNDGHKSTFTKDWLAKSGLKKDSRSAERQALTDFVFWDASIKSNPPTVPYEEIMSSDEGLKTWLLKIRKYGFSYVSGCPTTPDATEQLLLRIAFIRPTHYGGFYDFTADLAAGDTAYTQLGIGAHTDNTYFSEPAGLQMFHLLSHTGGAGGTSQLVDGFGAAAELRRRDPAAYRVLAAVPVHCHASGGDISIQPWTAHPVLVHDSSSGVLSQVRWNTTDRAAIDTPMEEMQAWYDAARKWACILREREYWEQLRPGQPLVFDNWRVLHGRSAFSGNRRMCGGYIGRDDYISRFRLMNWGRKRCLEEVARG
jgi:trimethyllysine dioxygenase